MAETTLTPASNSAADVPLADDAPQGGSHNHAGLQEFQTSTSSDHTGCVHPPREDVAQVRADASESDDPWELVGTELEGGLRVESVVGVGGFGTVYRAYHAHFRAPVALKVLRFPSRISNEQRLELLHRFEQETVLLFRLSRLTLNVASCLAAGTFTGKEGIATPYIVQEWLDGTSLEAALRIDAVTTHKFALREAIELLDPAVEALTVAHEQGVVHRDIKPSNLFLVQREQGKRAKLLDFGIAKILRDDLNVGGFKSTVTQGFRVLSVEYAAPEQWDEQLGPVSARTDLFSLALVVVEMLSGTPALEGNGTHALMFSTLDPMRRPTLGAKGFSIPESIERHLALALAVRPADRCDSLLGWWDELKQLAAAFPVWSATPPKRALRGPASSDHESKLPPAAARATRSSLVPRHGGGTNEPVTVEPAPVVEADSKRATRAHDGSDADAEQEVVGAKPRSAPPASRDKRRKLGLWITGGALAASAWLLLSAMFAQSQVPAAQRSEVQVAGVYQPASLGQPARGQHTLAPSGSGKTLARPAPSAPSLSAPSLSAQTAHSVGTLILAPSAPTAAQREPSPRQRAATDTPELTANLGVGSLAIEQATPSVDLKEEASRAGAAPHEAHTGELRLNSIPTSAILIDGRPIGSTPKASIHLSPGPHNVVFVHPEHGKRRLLVLVEAGKSQTLSIKF